MKILIKGRKLFYSMVLANNKPWTSKYAPKKVADVVGQAKSLLLLKKFVVDFKRQKRKAALMYGPTGSGKTSSVYALASELDLEVVELNASDFRTGDGIASVIGIASKQMSLFSKGKIILVDEIDGVSGTKDRGGIPELLRVIEGTAFPIVITANDPFDKKFSNLRKKSTLIEFDVLDTNSVAELLKKVAVEEGIDAEAEAVTALARRTGGDARAALNDLQMLSSGGKFVRSDLDMLSDREFTEELTSALTKVFKTTDPQIARTSFQNVSEDLDECLMWLDENIPKEYEKPADLARAYDYISKADVMRRRIRRWQHWRFMVYINDYLSAGVAISKDEKYRKMITLERSTRPLKIWMANRKYMKRISICERIAAKTHASKKEVVKSTYPFIKAMFQSGNKELIAGLISEFEFDDGEVSYLKK